MNLRPVLAAVSLAVALRLPAQAPSALPRSTPERQGVASRDILAFVQAADSSIDAMHGIVIVRHGQVIAEGWWAPYDARTRRWYTLSQNERGLQAVALDLTAKAPALLVRTAAGETRTPLGIGAWGRSAPGFANGMEKFLAVPSPLPVAASGAWSGDSTFTVKLVAVGTPYYSTMTFVFHGDALALDGAYNVNFGPTTVPRLEGRAAGR